MSKPIFKSALEGAQHGGPEGKTLRQFLHFAKVSGASSAQPSNFMLHTEGGGFESAANIKEIVESSGITLAGISAHCPFWVHTSAWTETKTIRPFISPYVATLSPEAIEHNQEDYLLRLMDLMAELGVKIMPMFWGVAYGLELASGYPWGLWKGNDYDLVKEGDERFQIKTAKLRAHANGAGIKLCHEIHPGTAAMCADDFLHLVDICDKDKSLAVNDDASHTWEGESAEQRVLKVGHLIYAAHVKNHRIRPGFPLRSMQSDWQKRAMQFTDLGSGEINLTRHAELLIQVGFPQRYCQVMGGTTAPLVVEAESAYQLLDHCSAGGIKWVNDHLCFPVAEGSFEKGMGAKE